MTLAVLADEARQPESLAFLVGAILAFDPMAVVHADVVAVGTIVVVPQYFDETAGVVGTQQINISLRDKSNNLRRNIYKFYTLIGPR